MKRYSIRNSIGQKTPNLSKQRNIRDPAYKAQCIQKLSSYLGDIDPKSLELPSVKEFQSIFKYFYSQLEPNLELIDNKFDDEAISFLRMMKYPYMTEVTKSQLMSISPHSWPALLSMLTWLCDICALNKPSEIKEESVESLFHEYVCESFKEYMLSGVENKEKEINYLKKVEGLAKKKEEEIERLKLELKEKKEKIALAENKPLGEISEELINYKNCKSKDIPQIKEHLKMKKEDLEQRNNANLIKAKDLDMKSKEKESEISALNSELEFLKEEVKKIDLVNENYKAKIENQGMSIEEIVSFRKKMKIYSEKIEQIKLINKEIKSKNIEKEKDYKIQVVKLEELLMDYKNKKSVLTKSFYENESNEDSENKNNSLVEDLLDLNEVTIFAKDLSLTITYLSDQLKTLQTKIHLLNLENQSYTNKLEIYNKEISDHTNAHETISKEIIEMSQTYIKLKENLESKRKRNEIEVENLKKEIYKLNLEGEDDLMITEKEYNLLLSKYDVHMLNLMSKKERVMKIVKEIEDGVINRYNVINDVLKNIQSDK